jgi:toxin ParE1/3/4
VRVSWDPKALERLEAIGTFIAQDSPAAAVRTVERIFDAVDELSTSPLRGRPGRVANTRELVIQRTPYIVVYRVRAPFVEVLAVQHSARRWPEHFDQ